MDGIKKSPLPTLQKIDESQKRPQWNPTPYYPKREELFIPKEETLLDPQEEKSLRKKRFLHLGIWIFIILLLTLFVSYITFFIWKAHASINKMNVSSEGKTTLVQDIGSIIAPIMPSTNKQLLRGEKEGRINILFLGAAGENKPGGNLTDTIMVMSIDTKNKKVAMLSLPRDLYVQVPASSSFVKINSLYKIGISQQKGADFIKEAVEKITDIKINYYVAVDFDAFQQIINNIGGVNIISQRDILDTTYPGPNYSYETFSLSKGPHLLDGATALKYVRERHNDPEGDFGRAKRQQQVIQSVKNKMFSMQTLFNVVALNNVLSTLGDNIKTDMGFSDIDKLIQLSKVVDTQNISNVVVDAWKPDSLLKVSHVQMGNAVAFILIPRVGNYSEIQDLAQNIFNQNELRKRSTEMTNENATINIINASGENSLSEKIRRLLTEKLNLKNVHVISNSQNMTSQQTKIFDATNGGKLFTLDELIKKLPGTLTNKLEISNENSTSDITIILGRDLVVTYGFEENTMQDLQNSNDEQN